MRQIVYILSLFALVSCEMKDPEFVKVKQVKIKTLNPITRSLTVSFRPVVHNPNSVPFSVSKVESEIFMDETHMGNAVSEEKIILKANEDSEFTIAQNIKVESLIKKLNSFVEKDSIKISLDTKFTFKVSDKEIVIPQLFESYIHPKKEFTGFLYSL